MISHFPISQRDRNEAQALLADIKAATEELRTLITSQKQFLSAEETAQYTGLSVKYIYKLTHTKQIPHYKPNRKLYFKRDDLDAWLMSHRVEEKK
ncbi:helix-turn-helix domain-containing protein [Vibrio parahaemolyticus]|uniref:helix-turn-helix domain-containing protein n=1 Tax=Vibrio parahaemolyticus TaxID=670 RepID=UPI00111D38F7|nr:helix-turn-helix domain-containing protein [Vibrio parahaemolyticus]MBE3843637.1 helix-turn-helix domain-containing protein [Vibrio parahaemolyticus]MBE3943716.1 helix-turn-helix domain-containing protein [Vibrio parahaemolyticus]MBE4119355.1 helix-turn-helix domain-containing protein [Vibrio parahaemolyticus]MBE4127954.1 helix-turn-helix domain-containing protein [Vibrio parahaemolyticus]MBE4780469.1 helix-turn-helix domain-containing protein [Vibrio parahaemolyticus]